MELKLRRAIEKNRDVVETPHKTLKGYTIPNRSNDQLRSRLNRGVHFEWVRDAMSKKLNRDVKEEYPLSTEEFTRRRKAGEYIDYNKQLDKFCGDHYGDEE